MTTPQTTASVSQPTPIPPRPTFYAVVYLSAHHPHSAGVWTLGYVNTVREIAEADATMRNGMLVTIPGSLAPSIQGTPDNSSVLSGESRPCRYPGACVCSAKTFAASGCAAHLSKPSHPPEPAGRDGPDYKAEAKAWREVESLSCMISTAKPHANHAAAFNRATTKLWGIWTMNEAHESIPDLTPQTLEPSKGECQHDYMGRPSLCSKCGRWNPKQPAETIAPPQPTPESGKDQCANCPHDRDAHWGAWDSGKACMLDNCKCRRFVIEPKPPESGKVGEEWLPEGMMPASYYEDPRRGDIRTRDSLWRSALSARLESCGVGTHLLDAFTQAARAAVDAANIPEMNPTREEPRP